MILNIKSSKPYFRRPQYKNLVKICYIRCCTPRMYVILYLVRNHPKYLHLHSDSDCVSNTCSADFSTVMLYEYWSPSSCSAETLNVPMQIMTHNIAIIGICYIQVVFVVINELNIEFERLAINSFKPIMFVLGLTA